MACFYPLQKHNFSSYVNLFFPLSLGGPGRVVGGKENQSSYATRFHSRASMCHIKNAYSNSKKVNKRDCYLPFHVSSQIIPSVLPYFCTSPVLSVKHCNLSFLHFPSMGRKKFNALHIKQEMVKWSSRNTYNLKVKTKACKIFCNIVQNLPQIT